MRLWLLIIGVIAIGFGFLNLSYKWFSSTDMMDAFGIIVGIVLLIMGLFLKKRV